MGFAGAQELLVGALEAYSCLGEAATMGSLKFKSLGITHI